MLRIETFEEGDVGIHILFISGRWRGFPEPLHANGVGQFDKRNSKYISTPAAARSRAAGDHPAMGQLQIKAAEAQIHMPRFSSLFALVSSKNGLSGNRSACEQIMIHSQFQSGFRSMKANPILSHFRYLALALSIIALAFGAGRVRAQSDDFDDRDDNGWTRYDPISAVAGPRASYFFTNGGYRIITLA